MATDARRVSPSRLDSRAGELLSYLATGAAFGIVLVKTEVISWYRIQEMFRFQSFHTYGVLGSAMVTAMIGIGDPEAKRRTRANR